MTDQIQNPGPLATAQIFFRDRFIDPVIYNDVIGFGVGGGAVQVMRETGESFVFPLDLVLRLEHKQNAE